MLSKVHEWVNPIQAGRVTDVLGGSSTPHIIELATHKGLLTKRFAEIRHLPDLENYLMNCPFLQYPGAT
eukprot:16437850-Heterocapsa_arctica.AAC.1